MTMGIVKIVSKCMYIWLRKYIQSKQFFIQLRLLHYVKLTFACYIMSTYSNIYPQFWMIYRILCQRFSVVWSIYHQFHYILCRSHYTSQWLCEPTFGHMETKIYIILRLLIGPQDESCIRISIVTRIVSIIPSSSLIFPIFFSFFWLINCDIRLKKQIIFIYFIRNCCDTHNRNNLFIDKNVCGKFVRFINIFQLESRLWSGISLRHWTKLCK